MDLLAKCFHNACIKQMVEVLIDIIKQDESLCVTFMEQCFEEDHCNYLMEILLECSDATARMYVGNLMKFIIVTLKKVESDRLFAIETVTTTNDKGEVTIVQQPASLCARFIMKCLSLLNTQVAKNWARFEYFLDILCTFGCGEGSPVSGSNVASPEQISESANQDDNSTIGLEFLLSVRFVERACDFMLGKKSSLCLPGEKRFEMGGSFN